MLKYILILLIGVTIYTSTCLADNTFYGQGEMQAVLLGLVHMKPDEIIEFCANEPETYQCVEYTEEQELQDSIVNIDRIDMVIE